MSYLIYTSLEASSGLIPQPGRAVNTFPSGLVRVDQTYLGLTSNAATHRAILAVGNDMPDGDTAPCIDGLKIFPEAQERRREDGFTEYIVSAYGRMNTTGKLSKSIAVSTVQIPALIIITNLPAGSSNSTPPVQMAVIVSTTAVTRSAVVPAFAPNSAIPLPSGDTSFSVISTTFEAIRASLKAVYPNGQFTLGGLTGAISVTAELKAITRSGFGSYDETTATLSGTPKAINFATITGTI
jgi:hypothetical protein